MNNFHSTFSEHHFLSTLWPLSTFWHLHVFICVRSFKVLEWAFICHFSCMCLHLSIRNICHIQKQQKHFILYPYSDLYCIYRKGLIILSFLISHSRWWIDLFITPSCKYFNVLYLTWIHLANCYIIMQVWTHFILVIKLGWINSLQLCHMANNSLWLSDAIRWLINSLWLYDAIWWLRQGGRLNILV